MRRVMLAMLLQSLLLLSLLAAASLADNKNEVASSSSSSSTVKDHTEDSVLVPTVPIGRGLHIPVLGLGTAALGGRGEEVVFNALNNGVKLIDTAQAYEWYSEDEVGRAVQRFFQQGQAAQGSSSGGKKNIDVVIVTKVHPRHFKRELLIDRVRESRRLIYGDLDEHRALDVVLLHSPYCWSGHCNAEEESYTWQEAWRALEELKERGEVLAIGVSNFDAQQLQELVHMANSKIAVIQNWMDPLHQDAPVRQVASENGIAYMAYSSFGTQWNAQKYSLRGNIVLDNPLLKQLSRKYGVGVTDVVLSWLMQENVIAIPRSSKIEHLVANNRYHFFLESEDVESIRRLDGSMGNPWD